MSRVKGLAARIRSILRSADAEARLDEEFRFHLETETEHLIREGSPNRRWDVVPVTVLLDARSNRNVQRNVAATRATKPENCVETVQGGLESVDEYGRLRSHVKQHRRAVWEFLNCLPKGG